MPDDVVWRPDPARSAQTPTARFMTIHGLATYEDLVERSHTDPAWFWAAAVEFLGITFEPAFTEVLNQNRGVPWTTWFTGGGLNLSAVCVDRWAELEPGRPALLSQREEGGPPAVLTFGGLREEVGRWAGALRSLGVERGEAVAGYLPMSAEAVILFLAAARIGAVFVPVFSGFGAAAVAQRLQRPPVKVLVTADGLVRRGRLNLMKEVATEAVRLAGADSTIAVVGYAGRTDTPMSTGDVRTDQLLARAEPTPPAATDAEDPVLLAYTSGTTGRPKAAVHVHGGLVVKLAVEGAFQFDLGPGDVLMWLTDMGWIMGPWMVVAGLANGATIATFDGVPDHPHPGRPWELTRELGVTVLGLSPTLVRTLQPHGTGHHRPQDLASLRAFGSTGEPWNPDPWWWLFRDIGQESRPIINISGGTEIGACILSAHPLQGIKPVSVGGPALGMAADVFDSDGHSVRSEVGELVVRRPWPAMTRGFWGDPERYLETYWSRFDDVWVHGDWASVDEDGFWYLHGRSDDTLNIAGKRIGPAEVESAAVALPEVTMAAAVAIPHPTKGESIALYVVAAPKARPGPELAGRVADAVAAGLGRPFRPSLVEFVADLPRTRSAKIMRRVVRALALGLDPGDLSSLENPESLAGFRPVE